MTVNNLLSNFVRCDNPLDVPESMCTLCMHTLVAPDLHALEQAEMRHTCSISDFGTLTGD
jgi:hypothetical protein